MPDQRKCHIITAQGRVVEVSPEYREEDPLLEEEAVIIKNPAGPQTGARLIVTVHRLWEPHVATFAVPSFGDEEELTAETVAEAYRQHHELLARARSQILDEEA